METAAFVVDRPRVAENRFDVRDVWEQRQWRAPSRRIQERSGLLDRAAQPFLGGPGDEPSPHFHVRAQRFSEGPFHPTSGLSDALRTFFISERVALSAKLSQRLVELLALQAGWDGESAKPPRPEVLANALGLLVFMSTAIPSFREPFVAPTIDGFAQLEWHDGRRTLEFEATPSGWSIVGAETTTRGEKFYHDTEAARFEIEKLIAAYRWFEGAELLWPVI